MTESKAVPAVSAAVQSEVTSVLQSQALLAANAKAFGQLCKEFAMQILRRPAVEAYVVSQLRAQAAFNNAAVDVISLVGHSLKAINETLTKVHDDAGCPARLFDMK